MTGSHHDLLLRLFEKALPLPPAARQTFLDSKCRGDAELEQRLRAMLAAADGQATMAPSNRPLQLLQQIGEGGFGVVFLAEQKSRSCAASR
jgi:serine/threonine protein kinase